jgi:hypothetical protein
MQFLFFCSYSLVDWKHQGRIPQDRKIQLIQEQLCRFLLDEVINPVGLYVGLSSIIVTGATTGEGTSQNNKEASGSKDQASGSKN